MRKKWIISLLFVAAVVTVAVVWGGRLFSKQVRGPEQVILITIDTLRADHVGSYGYPRNTSPFIDELASRGLRFAKARTACSHTAPAHASIFTGLLPFEHGVLENGMSLDRSIFNISQMYEEQGFTVGGFSAVGFMEGRMAFPELEKKYLTQPQRRRRKHWYRNAEDNVDRVIAWFDEKRPEKFFLWLHFFDVHQWNGRGQLPKQYPEMMKQEGDDALLERIALERGIDPAFFAAKKGLRWAFDGYDARLRFVDDQIKRLYEYLEEQGANSHALWIVTSDHGEGLGNHNYEGHGRFVYEEQLRIPLVLHTTGGETRPAVVDSDVQTIDILPTAAELLGVPWQQRAPRMSGDSLVPFFQQPGFTFAGVRRSFAQRRPRDSASHRRTWSPGDVYSFQDGRYKTIHQTDGLDEFYDLEDDPLELDNLNTDDGARQPPYSNLHQELEELLQSRSRAVDVQEEFDPATVEELKALGYL